MPWFYSLLFPSPSARYPLPLFFFSGWSSMVHIEDVPEYYARFDRQEEVKVLVRFP